MSDCKHEEFVNGACWDCGATEQAANLLDTVSELRAQLREAEERAESKHTAYRGLYALWLRVARAMTPEGGPDITDEQVAEYAEHIAAKVSTLEARHTNETLRQKAADLQTSKVRGFEKRDALIAQLEADLQAEREKRARFEEENVALRTEVALVGSRVLAEREKTARLEAQIAGTLDAQRKLNEVNFARIEAETLEKAAKHFAGPRGTIWEAFEVASELRALATRKEEDGNG